MRNRRSVRPALSRPPRQGPCSFPIARGAAALVALIALFGAAACQSGTAQSPSPSPAAPQGSPVPVQLDGAWRQVADPSVVMILTDNYYSSAGPLGSGYGNVVAKGSEIDFFNGSQCNSPLPAGIGKYRWTISGGLLMFSPLNTDPCPRAPYLADLKGWQKP
jgi:hypothetical protein